MVLNSSHKTAALISVFLATLLFGSLDCVRANASPSTLAKSCSSFLKGTNNQTLKRLNDFDPHNESARFNFFFRRIDQKIGKFFDNLLHLRGASLPPLPKGPAILEVFGFKPEDEAARKELQAAFESLIRIMEEPFAEEMIETQDRFFSVGGPVASGERKAAFKKICHFVKVRLRGVSPGDPALSAYKLMSKYEFKTVGLPLPVYKRVWRGILRTPKNLVLFTKRNARHPLLGIANLGNDIATEWLVIRRNPIAPFAVRAITANFSEELLDLKRALKEPHDEKPVIVTSTPRLYHLMALPKINDLIAQPSGRKLPVIPALEKVLKAKPALGEEASQATDIPAWAEKLNRTEVQWTANTLKSFAFHAETVLRARNPDKKFEDLTEEEIYEILLHFMSPERIKAMVWGIHAAHKEQGEFLESKRHEVESVLDDLQHTFDRYREIPDLIEENKASIRVFEKNPEFSASRDRNEVSRLLDENRTLQIERLQLAERLAALYLKAKVLTKHFYLQMDPVFDELYRRDNRIRYAAKRLTRKAQWELESRTTEERRKARDQFMAHNQPLLNDLLAGKHDPDALLASSAKSLHSSGILSRIPILRDIVPFAYMAVPFISLGTAYFTMLRQENLVDTKPVQITGATKYVRSESEFGDAKYELLMQWSISPPKKVELQAMELLWDQVEEADVPPEFMDKWITLASETAPFYYQSGRLTDLTSSADEWRAEFNKKDSQVRDLLDWTMRLAHYKNQKLRGVDDQKAHRVSTAVPINGGSSSTP